MGEDQGGADDVSDLARAGGDVMEGAPAAGGQGEPALAQAAKRPLEPVIGACIDIEVPAVWGVPDGDADADPGAFVSGVGQGGPAAAARYKAGRA